MIIKVVFACGTETKTIALSDKMVLREIQDVLHAAFELDREVVGLANEISNEIFPISFLKNGLAYFSQFSSSKNAVTILLKDYIDGTERGELIRDALMELVRAKVFDSIHVTELCEILENYTSDPMISREGFSSMIEEILSLSSTQGVSTLVPSDENAMHQQKNYNRNMLNDLFEAFDVNRTHSVDTDSMLNALIFMCHGTRDEKLEAGFQLFIDKRDDKLDESSLCAFLVAIFTVMHATDKETFVSKNMTIHELAVIAAKQCFESVSSNRIDFEQFRDWYVTPSTTTNISAKQGEQNSLPLFVSASRELITRFEERRDSGKLSRVAPFVALRRAAGLYNSTPKEMLEQFASVSNEEGLVTQESYLRVFQNLSRGSDIETSLSTARALFGSLVTSQDEDTVDFVELMTCVCLLAPGTLRERLHYVFSVYDLDEDGKIESPRDTTLLLLALLRLPFYGIVHHTHDEARPQKIAIERVLREEREGHVSFDAFYDWFVAYVDSNSCAADSNVMIMEDTKSKEDSSSCGIFEELREVAYEHLGLKHFRPEEIASIFRENCHGSRISRPKFRHAFELLARMGSAKHDSPLFESSVNEIFDAMDTGDGNDEISDSELYTGLAMLLNRGDGR